jgi:hypothetical protein
MAEQRVLTDPPETMPPLDGRALIDAITRFLANQEPDTLDRIRRAL